MSFRLHSERFTFYPTDPAVLLTTAKRYWKNEHSSAGVTLVCFHSLGSHKETYEPFIYDLYGTTPPNTIREVWSVDLPNHGEAGILNDQRLLSAPFNNHFAWHYGAKSMHAFLNGLGKGVNVNFSQRRVIVLGQSGGASQLALAVAMQPNIPLERIILIEPYTGSREFMKTMVPTINAMNGVVANRRHVWPTRDDAAKDLKRYAPWKYYDKRVFDLFLQHGLRDLPTGTHCQKDATGVTLTCTLAQEVATQLDYDGVYDIFDALPTFEKSAYLHLIYGTMHHPMLIPLEMKSLTIEQAKPTSVSWVDGPHLLVQLNPMGLAKAVKECLLDGQVVTEQTAKL